MDVDAAGPEPVRVFVSSAIRRRRRLRERIASQINQLAITRAWLFESAPASSEGARAVYLQRVRECEILIGIVFGLVPAGVCEELELASQLRKRRLLFISSRAPRASVSYLAALEGSPKYQSFASDDELVSEVGQAIYAEFVDVFREATQDPRPHPSRYVSLPRRSGPELERTDIIARVGRLFRVQSDTRLVALIGPAGVGKSVTAAQYARSAEASYGTVAWLNAAEPVALAGDMEALAKALGLARADDSSQAQVLRRLKAWLEQRESWLLIFDGAVDVSQVTGNLPEAWRGHVVVTSRGGGFEIANSIEIPPLADTLAADFLLHRSGSSDRASALKLAAAVGGLPLQLDLLAGYVRESGVTLADVAHALDRGSRLSPEASSAVAQALLEICAHFAPIDVPPQLFIGGEKLLPPRMRALALEEHLLPSTADLRARHLLLPDTDAISLHEETQRQVRIGLSLARQREGATVACSLAADAFPGRWDEPAYWLACERILPHGVVASNHASQLRVAALPTVKLLNNMGGYLARRGRVREAEALMERALVLCIASFGTGGPPYAECMQALGVMRHSVSDLAGAARYLGEAVKVWRQRGRADLRRLIISRNSAAVVEKHLGRLREASKTLEWVIETDRSAGRTGLPLAIALSNLAGVFLEAKRADAARRCLREALETMAGAESPEILLNNEANWLTEFGDPERAVQCHRELLRTRISVYGPDGPTTAISLCGLGRALQKIDQHAAAATLFREAIRVEEALFSRGHLRVGIALRNLSVSLEQLGQDDQAAACRAEALEVIRGVLGPRRQIVAAPIYW